MTSLRDGSVGSDSKRSVSMTSMRAGVTMMELLLVLLLSGMAMGVAVRESAQITDQRAVSSARDAVLTTAMIARSEAMQRGRPVFVRVRPDVGLVQVGITADTILQTVRMSDYGVTMVGDHNWVCYTSRGYAMPGCTSIQSVTDVSFRRGSETAGLAILPLGQMRRH